MTPEQAKRLLADGVLQAFAEGRKVQWRLEGNAWRDAGGNLSLDVSGCEYRVKPEPRRVWVRILKGCTSDLYWSVWSSKERAESGDGHCPDEIVEFVEVLK